jgi:type IV secretion system protein VirD4
MLDKHVISIPAKKTDPWNLKEAQNFFPTEIWALLGVSIIFMLMGNSSNGKKQQLTQARWASTKEKITAVKEAQKQLKEKTVKRVCLYCGSFQTHQMLGMTPTLTTTLTGYPPTLVVPSANRSMEVIGRPDSGKTFSFIDRVLASAIDQGFPILLYDYKGGSNGEGGQIPFIATYAVRHGYKLKVFAPGRDYSCTVNPLDFIRDPSDMTTAMSLAKTFHENLRGDSGSTDGFFGPAGQRLIYAIFQLAKSSQYPDLAMAFAILSLPKLPKRLVHAAEKNLDSFPFWVRVGFSQLMQVAGVDRTSGGILAGAADLITEFLQKDLLPCYLGESNTSLELKEKEILVFQSDIFRQKVVNPIVASLIDTLINLNFSNQREVPLVCSFDELPTITISNLPTWANEHRSKGYVGIYGYQSIEQLEKSYGKEGSSILRSALGTRVWFNPGNEGTAEVFSKYLGETEVKIKTNSVSNNWGGSGGGQRSQNEQIYQVPLMRVDRFTGFRQGECVFINGAYQNRDRGDVPWHLRQIKVSDRDKKVERECAELWRDEVLPALRNREVRSRPQLDLEREIKLRMELADKLLPLPDDEDEEEKQFKPVKPKYQPTQI